LPERSPHVAGRAASPDPSAPSPLRAVARQPPSPSRSRLWRAGAPIGRGICTPRPLHRPAAPKAATGARTPTGARCVNSSQECGWSAAAGPLVPSGRSLMEPRSRRCGTRDSGAPPADFFPESVKFPRPPHHIKPLAGIRPCSDPSRERIRGGGLCWPRCFLVCPPLDFAGVRTTSGVRRSRVRFR
jgi:hypothetical protein